MQKKMSKLLSCLLVFSSLGLTGNAVKAESVNNTDIPNMVETKESNNEAALQSTYWRTILKAAFKKVAGSISSPFNYDPEMSFGSTRDTVNSGSVKFNEGSNEFNTVAKDVYAQSAGHEIEMWANSQQVLYTGNIGVLLRDPNGTFQINRTVGHNQYSWYKIPSNKTGLYEAQFNTTSKHKWRLWVGYYHWGNSSSAMTYNIINQDSSVDKYKFTDIGEKRYLLPSAEHTKTMENPMIQGEESNYINFSGLHEQFYDLEHQSLVDVAKDYKAGDTIFISDYISDIRYDKKDNKTGFFFDNNDEFIEVHFEGNLTERFAIGDNVKFKFELIQLSKDHDFVIIDYNKLVEGENNAPTIEQFLVE